MGDKLKSVIIVITCFLLMLILIFFTIGIDFYNDYQCSTTNDQTYWKEHNCDRYNERNVNAR